jgi:hypothetical protein
MAMGRIHSKNSRQQLHQDSYRMDPFKERESSKADLLGDGKTRKGNMDAESKQQKERYQQGSAFIQQWI